jgi:hypothetical protein
MKVSNGKNSPTWGLVRVEREAAALYRTQLQTARVFSDHHADVIERLRGRVEKLEGELAAAWAHINAIGRCPVRQPYDRRDSQIRKLKDENRRLAARVAALEGDSFEGRTAASLHHELGVVRQLFYDHHIFGTCPGTEHIQQLQDEVRRLFRLMGARYKTIDNWRVRLRDSRAYWRCEICQNTYAGPLEYEWARHPCPHPGAPRPIDTRAA